MQKPSTPGGMKILRNEQGNILILGVFIILIISMLFAGMVEFGRVMLVREQLQTAVDSAALAGAGSGTHRYVHINVVTDPGEREVCRKDECWCVECSTKTRYNVPGNEADLIDGGDWLDYVYPPCGDCGGYNYWFELVDRNIGYDTNSMGWGVNEKEIDNAETEITAMTRETLAIYLNDYSNVVTQMVQGMSLQDMQNMLEYRSIWLSKWMGTKGYSANCSGESWPGEHAECYTWKNEGYRQYAKAISRKKTIDTAIESIKKMRKVNSKSIQKVDAQYAGAADTFFNANLPKNASESAISKIKVYGYEARNSPYYPSVVVYAKAKIKTLFPQWFNQDFNTTVCAQGTTAYRDADDQIGTGNKFYDSLNFGKWRKLPDKACWVDL